MFGFWSKTSVAHHQNGGSVTEATSLLRPPVLGKFGTAGVAVGLSLLFGGSALAGGSFVDLHVFGANEGPVLGASVLSRYEDRVDFSVHTTGLEPGHAYTLWAVVFNNPDACSNDCGADDFPQGVPGAKIGDDEPDPAVGASNVWAAGTIVGDDGTADFFGRIDKDDAPGAVLFGPSLVDPMNAEIHLIVRSHGRALVGHVAEQISTSQGLCTVTKPSPDSNKCLDVQAATHLP